jgi:nitrate reductase gamma subunit
VGLFHRDNIQKHFGWAVIASELSHVFCCVIPTLVTVLSVFANFGLFVMSPDGWLINIHNAMHHYEIPIILFSGVMVALGWVAHVFSRRVDCHDTGCGHPPCTPQKTKNYRILAVATILFIINIVIYFGVHRNILHLDIFRPQGLGQHIEHQHGDGQH